MATFRVTNSTPYIRLRGRTYRSGALIERASYDNPNIQAALAAGLIQVASGISDPTEGAFTAAQLRAMPSLDAASLRFAYCSDCFTLNKANRGELTKFSSGRWLLVDTDVLATENVTAFFRSMNFSTMLPMRNSNGRLAAGLRNISSFSSLTGEGYYNAGWSRWNVDDALTSNIISSASLAGQATCTRVTDGIQLTHPLNASASSRATISAFSPANLVFPPLEPDTDNVKYSYGSLLVTAPYTTLGAAYGIGFSNGVGGELTNMFEDERPYTVGRNFTGLVANDKFALTERAYLNIGCSDEEPATLGPLSAFNFLRSPEEIAESYHPLFFGGNTSTFLEFVSCTQAMDGTVPAWMEVYADGELIVKFASGTEAEINARDVMNGAQFWLPYVTFVRRNVAAQEEKLIVHETFTARTSVLENTEDSDTPDNWYIPEEGGGSL